MGRREYCRYIHTYSELEGLQRAHTVCYTASVEPQGILMEVMLLQAEKTVASRAWCLGSGFEQAMRLMRYLCENGVGPGQWLEVLDDVGQPYRRERKENEPEQPEKSARFVAIAGF